MQNTHVTWNHNLKTYCFTSGGVAMAMLYIGNPYGHNRMAKITDLKKLKETLANKGFTEAE